ncbi:MAG: hypothetical protein KC457_37255, partial [Myxococcales bacterium]|nr:hypothetical protein [Myxococcales bacterium]
MRDGDLSSARAALLSLTLLGLLACRDGEAKRPEATGAAGADAAADAKEPAAPPTPPADQAAPVPADPERADKLADLDELCAAVDHDYKDGTLGDYYAKVEMRTDWGRAQRDAGNES